MESFVLILSRAILFQDAMREQRHVLGPKINLLNSKQIFVLLMQIWKKYDKFLAFRLLFGGMMLHMLFTPATTTIQFWSRPSFSLLTVCKNNSDDDGIYWPFMAGCFINSERCPIQRLDFFFTIFYLKANSIKQITFVRTRVCNSFQ